MSIYTVFSPQGDTPAKVMHQSFDEAMGAARNLARKHRGSSFMVMKAVSTVVRSPKAEVE